MAKHNCVQAQFGQFGGFTPFGNTTTLTFNLIADGSGKLLGDNNKEPVKAGDVIKIGSLPAGMTMMDAIALVMTASDNVIDVGIDSGVAGEAKPKYLYSSFPITTRSRAPLQEQAGDILDKEHDLIVTLEKDLVGPVEVIIHITGELRGPN